MPDDPNPTAPTSNGAIPTEPTPSLRDIAEAAYDEVVDAADSDGADDGEQVSGQGDRPRDSLGRFAAKAPEAPEGEQSPQDPAPPSEASRAAEQPTQPTGSEPPQHWSAEDRRMFAELPQQGQAFLLRRYSEMEADYTRKTQSTAGAVQFTNSLAPIFNDPVISGSLQQFGMSPAQAIESWAALHRRGQSPQLQDRIGVVVEVAQNLGLDPARLFGTSPSGPTPQLSEADAKDPAIRYVTGHIARTQNEVQALRGTIENMQRATQQAAQAEALKVTRWGIDSWADEVGPDGRKLRPDFDEQLPYILELFRANPDRDLKEAYETARRMNPATNKAAIDAAVAAAMSKASGNKAVVASRANVRGMTSPVAKPEAANGSAGLRSVLEQAADEVGF